MKNHGISVSGGTVNAGAMAAGRDASATNVVHQAPPPGSLDELRVQVAALAEAVRAHAADLEDGASTLTVARVAEHEVGKDRPNKESLLGMLATLAAGVSSVGVLAGAVTTIQHAVTSLL